MALINVNCVIQDSIRWLKKTPSCGGIGLFSYKRNRKIILTRKSEDMCTLREDGYIQQEKDIPMRALDKELRTSVKREFPRSRKIRFYKFAHEDELKTAYKKI